MRKWPLFLLFFVVVTIASMDATAQPTPPDLRPIHLDRPGLPPLIDFSLPNQRRIAEYRFKKSANHRLRVPLQITENECGDRSRPACEAFSDVRLYNVSMVWREHPDAAKIGQPVRFLNSPAPIDALVFSLPLIPSQLGALGEGLDPSEIRCPQWDWIPAVSRATGLWQVLRWESELNTTNPETGRNENISNGALYDVAWSRSPNGFTASSLVSSNLSFFGIPFLQGISFLFMEESDGNACQTTMQAGDSARLSREIDQLMKQMQPYAGANDDLVRRMQDLGFFYWLMNPREVFE